MITNFNDIRNNPALIDLGLLRQHPAVAVIGHKNADLDSMVAGYLMTHTLRELGINAKFAILDSKVDPYFQTMANLLHFNIEFETALNDGDALFLVDHDDAYDHPVVGCFDHHPTNVGVEHNYLNIPKTCCALIVHEWAELMGVKVPEVFTKMTIYACHMDSLSFKSSKALPEDRVWCRKMMTEFGINEAEVISFGYGLTDRNLPYDEYLLTGKKSHAFGDKQICSSYAVTEDNDDDLDKAARTLKNWLNDDVVAWCYLIQNAKDDVTHILLVTKDYYMIQTVNRLLSRGKDVIPPVIAYLSSANDGEVTKLMIDNGMKVATMESCTSGLIASNITDYEGASAVLEGSCITYANRTKVMAGVNADIIDTYGVYSAETAAAMAKATREKFNADVGIGITGSMGNVDPANPDSVAGEIYFHILHDGNENPIKLVYPKLDDPRKKMKQRTVDIVIRVLHTILMRKHKK